MFQRSLLVIELLGRKKNKSGLDYGELNPSFNVTIYKHHDKIRNIVNTEIPNLKPRGN